MSNSSLRPILDLEVPNLAAAAWREVVRRMEVFRRTSGTAQNLDLYQEDDALFGFFVKGLSALESFYYGLYTLGKVCVSSTRLL